MKAYLEITGGVIRVYQDDAEFGTPYDKAMYIIGDLGVATIKGLRTNDLTIEDARATLRCLADHSFTHAVWDRHKREKIIPVKFDLAKYRSHPC